MLNGKLLLQVRRMLELELRWRGKVDGLGGEVRRRLGGGYVQVNGSLKSLRRSQLEVSRRG